MTPALHFVSRHLPEPEGSAAGRHLLAMCEGFIEVGASIRLTSWRPEPPTDAGELPAWCDWKPVAYEPHWRTRARALARPRWDASRLDVEIASDELAIADDPDSWAAVSARTHAQGTLHYSAQLDARAIGSRSPKAAQDMRAQRRMLRQASRTVAYSDRVADWARGHGRDVRVAPIALRVAPALPPVSRPVAACIADWRWPPNGAALTALTRLWPELRAHVPGAELLIAGRGCEPITGLAGVTALGVVTSALDVLEQAAVLAFPCPPSSGPKVKVLEAVMAGRPVVTTPHGVEGLNVGEGAVVSSQAGFSAALARTLRNAAEGSSQIARGRRLAMATHAPVQVARTRLLAMDIPLPSLTP